MILKTKEASKYIEVDTKMEILEKIMSDEWVFEITVEDAKQAMEAMIAEALVGY